MADRASASSSSGWTPFGWRVAVGRRRHADGAGDDPAGPPAHRLDAARLRRRAAARASTACTSCCPGWRCSTSSWRSSCSARSPAWSPTGTGAGCGWPGWCRPATARPPATGARCAACSGGRGGWPPACSSGWPAPPSGTRCSRWRRSACWSWMWDAGARRVARRARRPAALRSSSTRSRRSATSSSSRSSSTSLSLDRLAAARRRLRDGAVRHAVRPLLGQLPRARRRTASSPSCGSRCARCGTTTTTSTPSTPGSSTTPRTPTSRSRRAG